MAKGVSHCLSILIIFLSLAFVAQSSCTYRVKLKTGNVDRAGTNARVLLRLYDKDGHSIDAQSLRRFGIGRVLKDYFEEGQLDSFEIPGKCLNVCKMELSHNDNGLGSGWYVSYLEVVVVNNETKSSSAVRRFNIEQWLAEDEPPFSLSVIKNQC